MNHITILSGRAGSGKTDYLIDCLQGHMQRGERALLLVPEQRTYEAEKRVVCRLGGMLGVQVLSMERLCERTLQQGGDHRSYLSTQGIQMGIRSAVIRHRDSLRGFSASCTKPGFAQELAGVISSCKQNMITADMLMEASECLKERQMLSDKLHDVALLYGELDALMRGRFLSQDDALNEALTLLPQSAAAGAHVYVDGLSAVTGQVMAFLGALIPVAASLTVSLTMDDGTGEETVFGPNRRAYDRLMAMAEKKGLSVKEKTMGKIPSADGALAHLEKQFFRPEQAVYPREASSIRIYEAQDRGAEVRALCDTVITLARGGMRYRDMAVIVSDMEAYQRELERVQTAYGVPVFLNLRRPVRGHAAVELLFCAVRAAGNGFATGDILSLAKTGYAGLDLYDASELENYVLRCGIHHGMFEKPFTRGNPGEAETYRSRLMGPLLRLRDGLRTAASASGKVQACHAYLEEQEVRQRLELQVQALLQEQQVTAAQEHIQVYEALSGLFSQIETILGDVEMDLKEFQGILEEGLGGVTLGVVPDSADCLQVSPVARADGLSCRALLLLGCSEGLMPKDHSDDGIFNDEEKAAINGVSRDGQMGLPASGVVAEYEQLMLYEAFTRPSEQIWFFYPLMAGAEDMRESPMVGQIREMFPHCQKLGGGLHRGGELPSCRAAALRRMTALMCLRAEKGISEEEQQELALLQLWFSRNEPALMANLLAAGTALQTPGIGRAQAHVLYGDSLNVSASRLEEFNQCPFRHFLDYGLGVSTRELYGTHITDVGTLYHEVLKEFFLYLQEHGIALAQVDETLLQEILDTVFPVAAAKYQGGVAVDDAHMQLLFSLYRDTAGHTVEEAIRQLLAGSFEPFRLEKPFNSHEEGAFRPITLTTREGNRVTIRGIIDRIDRAEENGRVYYRVIDYKTGGRDISYGDIADGYTLQLPLYLAVTLENLPEGEPGGMYYMRIQVNAQKEGEEEKPFQLSGLTNSAEDSVNAADHSVYGEGKNSRIVKGLKYTKKEGRASGSVASGEDIGQLIYYATSKACGTVDHILQGDARVSPCEQACTYCSYQSVCRFDTKISGNTMRKKRKVSLEEFFAGAEGGRSE